MLRSLTVTCALLVLAVAQVVSGAGEYVWLEGENPTTKNVAVEPSGWGNTQFLSGGKWLCYMVKPEEAEKAVPAGGALFDYAFTIAQAGAYEVWDRIGFESIRTPFAWRLDQGEWREVKGTELATDLMRIDFFCEVSWLKLGDAELAAGQHVLSVRVPVTYTEDKGQKKPRNVNFTVDVFGLFKEPFRPNGKHRPDAEWRQDLDRQAEQQVFTVPLPKAVGERATVSLAGTWQAARYDEQEIDDRCGPIKRPPNAAECYWLGIPVPGDKNVVRPELAMCHRFFYRCRVQVPAELAGDSFVLHFPGNNLITTVFVNGTYCGFTRAPLAPWDCDVTQAVKPGAVNEVWVGIKDYYYAWPADTRAGFVIPVEHKTAQWNTEKMDFPVAGRAASGILGAPSLIVAGGVYVADVFARPSVKSRELALETTLKDPKGTGMVVTTQHELVPLAGGPAAKVITGNPGAVDPDVVSTVTAPWREARLWWPDDPYQYLAVTSLLSNGQVVDRTTTKFGFREWEWAGPEFKLNGVPWHGRADCLAGTPPELKQRGQNMVRLWGSSLDVTEAQLDEMDAAGMPVRWTGIFDGQGGAYGTFQGGAPALFEHWNEQLTAWVKGARNHPSLFIWSIENEMTFINIRNWGRSKDLEPLMRKSAELVLDLDGTRPVMVDGGRALLDNSLPVYGCHYEETAPRDYPDEAYTLQQMLTRKDWWQPWPIDRNKPILIGESFYVNGSPPAWYAGLGGEQAFLGRAEARAGASLMLRMLSEGYRWNNISFHCWSQAEGGDLHYRAWTDVALFCRQWNWTFAGGATIPRTLKLLNDTRFPEPITATWKLIVGGKTTDEGQRTMAVPPGGAEQFEISLKVPTVRTRTAAQVVLTCVRGGKEVFCEVYPVALIAPDRTAKPKLSKTDLLVYDPTGAAKARLARRGIAFTEVAKPEDLPFQPKVIVIGRNALTPRQATDPFWQALAAAGARVVVLDQQHPLRYLATPADFEVTAHVGRIAFIENRDHPVFAGLDQPDFRTWSGDHVVYRNVYRKASRGAVSLVQCDEELGCTALALCPVNEGALLLCQLVVGEKLEMDPVARQLFDNLLNFAATYAPVRKATAVALPAASPEGKLLAAAGLQYDAVPDVLAALSAGKHELVVADASPATLAKLAAAPAALKTFTDRGGYLMLWGLTEAGLADFNRIVGVEHLMRPFEMERVTLPAVRDPVLSGLTMRDVVMESGQQINTWAGDRFAAADVFTSVVDVGDVAPFATFPDGKTFGYNDSKPGWDHWPRNMVNGFLSGDSWKYAFTMFTNEATLKWPLTFPRPLELTELQLIFTPFFAPVRKVNLYFDQDPQPASFTVSPNWKEKQVFTLPAPRSAKVLTIELAEFEKGRDGRTLIGVDNLWLYAKRSPEFGQRVKPLLNIGALVKYQMGKGGVILNNLRVQEPEPVPVNAQKKRAIVSTLLRNLGAVFSGGKAVVPGAGMNYAPVELGEKCNAFLTRDKGWFDARDLSAFPKGEQHFAGVTYLIRDFKTSPLPACLMLAGPGTPSGLPREVTGLPVNHTADALFFLHAFKRVKDWQPPQKGDPTPPVLFKYVVHYADGQVAEVPVRYGEGADHWLSKEPRGLRQAAVAWAAPFPGDASGEQAVVYQLQWDNPRPEVGIATVDVTYDAATHGAFGIPVLLGLSCATIVK